MEKICAFRVAVLNKNYLCGNAVSKPNTDTAISAKKNFQPSFGKCDAFKKHRDSTNFLKIQLKFWEKELLTRQYCSITGLKSSEHVGAKESIRQCWLFPRKAEAIAFFS